MIPSVTTAAFSELVGLIYDAAIDPGRWRESIEAIRISLRFENAVFGLQSLPRGDVLVNVATNIPAEYVMRMPDYGSDIVELVGTPAEIQALPMDEPIVLSRINPRMVNPATSTNRYVLEWARPQGLADAMTLALARDERAVGSLSLGRHLEAGPIGDAEVEAARLLLPHLQRAATINRLLDMAAVEKSTFAGALDSLTVPVFLVTSALGVVHANPAAVDLMAADDLLRVQDGKLESRVAPVSRALAVAVEQAIRDEATMGRKGLGIPVRRDTAPPGALHVLPLRSGRYSAGVGPMAAIFVARSDTPFVAPTRLAAALFAFTPAEARVFEQIAIGRTVTEASEALDVERSTVRTHLLRLFEKTGTKRQAELIQLAASLSMPIAS
ncbi:helix-turn-helix transcriptional regulator [Sphingomonas sp.]|uniref:helix-turn-helix transcriptional regulator n=1 Tax=Sphingomonas sp. TaxID=28214 RepID=UPI0025D5ADCA|nr:helix-turn-helix transcriptional regulator [Sphingomonas sp.]